MGHTAIPNIQARKSENVKMDLDISNKMVKFTDGTISLDFGFYKFSSDSEVTLKEVKLTHLQEVHSRYKVSQQSNFYKS